MRFLALVRLLVLVQGLGSRPTSAWKSCSEEDGGGICPDETTCCPTETPGVSACIPLVHTDGPPDMPRGRCCRDSSTVTGCRFGYECAVSVSSRDPVRDRDTTKRITRLGGSHRQDPNKVVEDPARPYCKATEETMAFDPLARDTPRYDLCRIPEGTTKLYGFPVESSPDVDITTAMGDDHPDDDDVFRLAYFSNLGPIASRGNDSDEPNETVEQAVIVIHGSLRDAEDYFCAGLSLIQDGDTNGTTLILAPKFASVRDNLAETYGPSRSSSSEFLVWDDSVEVNDEFLWHTWRYGADAANAPISSFAALDQFVQHLVDETSGRFPNLRQITLAGHSAGGQTLQRWALLSDISAWSTFDIKVVVANPRSYAYLDGRRWLSANPEDDDQADTNNNNNNSPVFRLPTPNDGIDEYCPWYNLWLWGLDDGGDEVPCPYRDEAVANAGSAAVIATRYASRNVIYLSGKYDTIPQPNDRCGNAIQGGNRHERALRFYQGLQAYFGHPMPPVHTLYTIPSSNHDHAFMFQSPLGKHAILGLPVVDDDDDEKTHSPMEDAVTALGC